MGRGRYMFRACCRVPGRLPQRHAGFKRLWQKSVSACRGLACCRLRRSGAPAVRAVQHSACDFCLSQFRLSRGTGACGKLSGIDRRLVAVRPGRTSQSVRPSVCSRCGVQSAKGFSWLTWYAAKKQRRQCRLRRYARLSESDLCQGCQSGFESLRPSRQVSVAGGVWQVRYYHTAEVRGANGKTHSARQSATD